MNINCFTRIARRNLAKTAGGIVTRRLLREDSKKEPRKDDEGDVPKRLI
ncbi:MAG: hypothetical protein FWG98_10955 [Candidatus Cloacimonetes bacterium]|nr:hypothetical protein [Candidatus Cloacimonadota bacterium]